MRTESLELSRRRGGALSRQERRTALTVREAQVPAQVAAGKIEAAAFAANVALHHAGMLSATEARLLELAPTGDARYKAIVDTFAGYASHEIALLAHK